jgi:hypothetical protein
MTRLLLLVAGVLLSASGAVLLMYRGIVRGSYLFVTAGTVLTPLAIVDFIAGLLCLGVFIAEMVRGRKNG